MISPVKLYPSLPCELTVYVNWACNLRCAHCYLYGVADSERPYMADQTHSSLEWAIFERAIDPLLTQGEPFSICFMGGEPCLHRQIVEMVRYAKSSGLSYVDMNTNGTLLRRLAKPLMLAGIDAIYISIDGPTAQSNDTIRGRGTFDVIVQAIAHTFAARASIGAATKIALNVTVTNANYRCLGEFRLFCAENKIDEIFFNLPSFVTHEDGLRASQIAAKELGIEFHSWQGLVIDPLVNGINSDDLTTELEGLISEPWPCTVFLQPVGYKPRELSAYFTKSWPQVVKGQACPILGHRTTILPNGDITPCTIFPDIVVGSLREATLSEVWQGRPYSNFRKILERRLLPTCSRCCDLFDETKGEPGGFFNQTRLAQVLLPISGTQE